MKKKFPDYTEINFQNNETISRELPVSVKEGDFFIEKDVFITSDIFIPQGVYSARNHMAFFPVIHTKNEKTTLYFHTEIPIAQIHNFEEIGDFPKQSLHIANISDEIRTTTHLNSEEKPKLLEIIHEFEDVLYRDGSDYYV